MKSPGTNGGLKRPVWLFLFAMLASFLTGSFSQAAFAQSLLERTDLVNIGIGGELSDTARDISHADYELADGHRVAMRRWYRSAWTNMHVDFMTEIAPGSGVLWGLSTGEYGKKYHIQPAFRLGFIQQFQTSENGLLTFRFVATLGGRMKEKTCTADYGEIGGIQKVNCRLAASPLPPQETLSYLLDEKPDDAIAASFTYQLRF